MTANPAVKVEGVGKCYRLFPNETARIVEWITRGHARRHEEKWALKDVSFELQRGSALGIIGGNGAGKSTLLKILTGTTRPTTGQFVVNGRLGSLLELGAGFHPEFTGKDNLYMNAAVLGIPKAEVKARYEELVSFAELGEYLHQPVRTYSSGMAMRLGFTVAMMANPEIMILDEVLAVGDQHFQKKCMDRIRDIRKSGTTILFVSHSIYHVRQMCDEAIWLHEGQVVMHGKPVDVTDEYVNFQYALSGRAVRDRRAEGRPRRVAGPPAPDRRQDQPCRKHHPRNEVRVRRRDGDPRRLEGPEARGTAPRRHHRVPERRHHDLRVEHGQRRRTAARPRRQGRRAHSGVDARGRVLPLGLPRRGEPRARRGPAALVGPVQGDLRRHREGHLPARREMAGGRNAPP